MKKDKLYTVTKGNKTPISKGINKKNLFALGGEGNINFGTSGASIPLGNITNPSIKIPSKLNVSGLIPPSTPNVFGVGTLGGSLLGAAGTAVNQGALKLIGGDYETGGVGEGIASVGNTIGGIVSNFNPLVGSIVQGATGVIGGGVNRLFGIATNEENLAKANNTISTGKNFRSAAATNEGLVNAPSFASVGRVYKGGLLRKGDGNRKDTAIHNDINDAIAFVDRSLENNRVNIASDNINNQLAVYSAFGGPLDRISDDMGAIEYGFMSDYLANKKKQVENQNKTPGISPMPFNAFGKGGCLCNKFGEGGIEIKHPGRLTRLKERTGKTEAELWAEGRPEVKKMITFARNSRKWSKAMGGQLHKDGVTIPDNVFCKGGKLFPYGGGMFYGSGAGGSWDDTTDTYPEVTNFNEAFDKAVAEGLPEFLFQGRRYNTQKENNPVREYNNRWVGQGRKANVKNPSKAYDRQAGPLGGPLAAIPMVTDTYIGSPERPPMLDFNPFAMERGKMLPYSWSRTVDRPKNVRALGGDIQTNGTDFTSGLSHINEGSTHELNPNEGVQVGVDAEGTPNLVEEGETIYNDYVYSNRIELDDEAKEAFHVGKKKEITYADMSKNLEKEISERPNDPISKAAFEKQMQDLADHQERQKQEMEAERAQQAFDALTPEEQVDVMNYAQQREQAKEAAMQEQAMAQEAMAQQQMTMQQPMQEVPQEPMPQEQMAVPTEGNITAEGGQLNKKNLFPWGGLENLFNIDPRYQPSNTVGFIPYDRALTEEEVLKREQDPTFRAWTDYVNNNWLADDVMSYLRALDAAAGGNHLFDKDGNLTKDAKDYFNRARTQNHKWGYYHLTPNYTDDIQQPNRVTSEILNNQPSGRIFHRVEGADDYLPNDSSGWNNVGSEIRREVTPDGDTIIWHAQGNPENTDSMTLTEGQLQQAGNNVDGINGWEVEPNYRNENLRYAGILGPIAGLGLMVAGVGKPDRGAFDAVLNAYDGSGLALADYRPLGNYMTYRPMDMWAEQNRMNANARATDRALSNTSSPSRAAGLLANAYNNQVASGQLYRQGLEYNNNLNEKVQTFNRQTDQYNADAYNRVALANADAINRDRQYRAQLAMGIEGQKAAMDQGWYNSLYGNVGGIFKGLADVGRENAQHNMIAEMAANGLFGPMSPNTKVGRKGKYLTFTPTYVAKKGGKLNRKKGGK